MSRGQGAHCWPPGRPRARRRTEGSTALHVRCSWGEDAPQNAPVLRPCGLPAPPPLQRAFGHPFHAKPAANDILSITIPITSAPASIYAVNSRNHRSAPPTMSSVEARTTRALLGQGHGNTLNFSHSDHQSLPRTARSPPTVFPHKLTHMPAETFALGGPTCILSPHMVNAHPRPVPAPLAAPTARWTAATSTTAPIRICRAALHCG